MSDLSLLDGDFPLTAEYLTPMLLDMPQASCPIYHRFGPGIYIRELHMAAGTMAIGHIQKQDHINILLKGKVLMVNEDESTHIVEAPMFFIGKAGSRKVGMVLEDMVWQNIYATEETDIEKLEECFLDKTSLAPHVNLLASEQEEQLQHIRNDYTTLLSEIGMTEEQVQAQVSIDDVVEFDEPNQLRVTYSTIDGVGLFTTVPIEANTYVCKARVNGRRTPAGRYVNHSPTPNCKMVLLENNDMLLVSLVNINGCLGGGVGTELTVNYREVLKLNPQIIQEK
jgi:hypothetical protein